MRFVHSLIIFPVFATSSMLFGGTGDNQFVQNVLTTKVNIEVLTLLAQKSKVVQGLEVLEQNRLAKAKAIDIYFESRDMPLEGTGKKMVEEAEKNDIDWRLLPAIAVRESTGGKNDCKKVSNNAFGWGSCRIGFKSKEEAIEVVARNLGGNNPNTAHYYDHKTTKQILRAYNPPSVVPKYAEQVMNIMNGIGDADTTKTNAIAINT